MHDQPPKVTKRNKCYKAQGLPGKCLAEFLAGRFAALVGFHIEVSIQQNVTVLDRLRFKLAEDAVKRISAALHFAALQGAVVRLRFLHTTIEYLRHFLFKFGAIRIK